MPKVTAFTVKLPTGADTFQHSIKTPRTLEARIRRAMHYGGYKDFSAFALAAFASRCRQLEQEHGLPADVEV